MLKGHRPITILQHSLCSIAVATFESRLEQPTMLSPPQSSPLSHVFDHCDSRRRDRKENTLSISCGLIGRAIRGSTSSNYQLQLQIFRVILLSTDIGSFYKPR